MALVSLCDFSVHGDFVLQALALCPTFLHLWHSVYLKGQDCGVCSPRHLWQVVD